MRARRIRLHKQKMDIHNNAALKTQEQPLQSLNNLDFCGLFQIFPGLLDFYGLILISRFFRILDGLFWIKIRLNPLFPPCPHDYFDPTKSCTQRRAIGIRRHKLPFPLFFRLT